MRRKVHVYLNVFVYRKFTSLCKFLGVGVADTLEKLMIDFVEKHKDHVPLDYYLAEKGAKPQIISFNFTQNYSIILAKIARLDPGKWLEDLQAIDPDRLEPRQAEFWKEKLSELIMEASKALEEIMLIGYNTEYAELLQDLITRASEILQKLLKKKSQREPIHV